MYIRWFKNLNIKDIPSVGGKTASLGEMFSKLTKKGVKIPDGGGGCVEHIQFARRWQIPVRVPVLVQIVARYRRRVRRIGIG